MCVLLEVNTAIKVDRSIAATLVIEGSFISEQCVPEKDGWYMRHPMDMGKREWAEDELESTLEYVSDQCDENYDPNYDV